MPASADSVAAFLEQLNSQGARGFRFTGGYVTDGSDQAIYRRQNGSSATYDYRLDPASDPASDAQLMYPPFSTGARVLAQAKARGAEGYQYRGSYSFPSPVGTFNVVRIYRKEQQGTASFDYELLPASTNPVDMLAQISAQGARGFRYLSAFIFNLENGQGLENLVMYEKDTSQSASFSYLLLSAQDDVDAAMAQANAQGAEGYGLIGDYMFVNSEAKTFFVKASNCTGSTCEPRTPFDF